MDGAGEGGHWQRRTLVIECATPALSLALIERGAPIAHHHVEIGRGHAEALLPAIAAMPGQGHCDAVLVDVGPGSFTGVRVGLAAARALGFAWGVPVRGYGCLDLVAAMVRARHAPMAPFVVAMVGGHGELFWQRFGPDGQDHDAGRVESLPIAELAARIDDATIFGSGAELLVAARGTGGEAVPILPDAREAVRLAPSHILPVAMARYGRGADARPMQPAMTPVP